jgi:hypothetical protein
MSFLSLYFLMLTHFSSAQMHCENVFKSPSDWIVTSGDIVYDKRYSHGFRVNDRISGFSFEALMDKHGEVKIYAYLADLKAKVRSGLNGPRLYREMVQHFGLENIKTIIGLWNDGSNLMMFEKAKEQGYDSSDAALQTWSGRQAASYGFSRVNKVYEKYNPAVGIKVIEVEFVRPQ